MSWYIVSGGKYAIDRISKLEVNTKEEIGAYIKSHVERLLPFFNDINCINGQGEIYPIIKGLFKELRNTYPHFDDFDEDNLKKELEKRTLIESDFDPEYYHVRKEFIEKLTSQLQNFSNKKIVKNLYICDEDTDIHISIQEINVE